MQGRADSRHNVFALRVQQEISKEYLLAGGGIARETHACTGIVSRISKYHVDHVNASAKQARNFLDSPVSYCFFAHP